MTEHKNWSDDRPLGCWYCQKQTVYFTLAGERICSKCGRWYRWLDAVEL